jgi:hypothetical protein
MAHPTHSDEAINRIPKYHVDVKNPKNTGTATRPVFGPSGTQNGTGKKVYTRKDVELYRKTYDKAFPNK